MHNLVESFFWASAIALAAPILLAALGETFAQRAGVFTIGIEGLMLSGAFGAAAVASWSGDVIVGFAGAALAGAVLGALYGVAVVLFRADQVVVGIGFNLIVLGATSMLRRGLFPTGMEVPSTSALDRHELPLLGDLPWIGEVLFDQSPIVYALYVLTPFGVFLLFRTRVGLLVRAVGDGALASSAAGIRVPRIRMWVMVVNGTLAGAAGATLVLVNAGGVFVDNLVDGRGYLVLALTMFARWHPGWVALGAVLFGAADALQFIAQATFGGHVPTAVFLMAPYLLALAAWVVMGKRSRAPSDLGVPLLA
ncbi:ABC transporter permease [Nocardioides sp. LMS-CY]|uniref:Simple sugar transport system permease protein n=1 Tax=Nocardioides soli TaxID=1036020 RepID=A0A7W4VWK6_9ACTN|nr:MULTISPECIES: ABC transporter permease [Nocardioides]MBB3043116.1 simple sugar transport system permease protein [Nocardioides soli]QWF23188.1 ABC transporter permease [Nocardioides sp. LMS-CY]